jgi:chromosome segregation ATPase
MDKDRDSGLGRGLFGYRRTSVDRLLSDREILLRQAEGRARAAEEKFGSVASELATLREQVARRDEEVARLRSEVAEMEGRGERPSEDGEGSEQQGAVQPAWQPRESVTTETVSREIEAVLQAADAVGQQIAGVLRAAEESAVRVVETTQATTRQQLVDAQRLWSEVNSAYTRFVSWQRDLEPVLVAFQQEMVGVKSRMDEIPDRVQEAFTPLSRSIATADERIEGLRAAWNPPLVVPVPGEAGVGAEGYEHPNGWNGSESQTPENASPEAEHESEPEAEPPY